MRSAPASASALTSACARWRYSALVDGALFVASICASMVAIFSRIAAAAS
jgi:hypothetical protein